MVEIEAVVVHIVEVLKLIVEFIGVGIIAVGVFIACVQLAKSAIKREKGGFGLVRLSLARYLALALEFQLGADILATAIAPSWDEIGKLGAIAVIRTALNHFLMKEMKEQEEANEAAHHEE